MYRKLGAKLVVGMPFKDQACSDTLVLPQVPPASDTDKRRALARLQVCSHCEV
jgi:(E)-4-hydroxy-3-methylbut-2-enyl-diphosphate synthase